MPEPCQSPGIQQMLGPVVCVAFLCAYLRICDSVIVASQRRPAAYVLARLESNDCTILIIDMRSTSATASTIFLETLKYDVNIDLPISVVFDLVL